MIGLMVENDPLIIFMVGALVGGFIMFIIFNWEDKRRRKS